MDRFWSFLRTADASVSSDLCAEIEQWQTQVSGVSTSNLRNVAQYKKTIANGSASQRLTTPYVAESDEGTNTTDLTMMTSSSCSQVMDASCPNEGEVKLSDSHVLHAKDRPEGPSMSQLSGTPLKTYAGPAFVGACSSSVIASQTSKLEEPPAKGDKVKVSVSAGFMRTDFKMAPKVRFRKMMRRWCEHQRLPLDIVRFEFAGRELSPEDCPQSCGWSADRGVLEIKALPRDTSFPESPNRQACTALQDDNANKIGEKSPDEPQSYGWSVGCGVLPRDNSFPESLSQACSTFQEDSAFEIEEKSQESELGYSSDSASEFQQKFVGYSNSMSSVPNNLALPEEPKSPHEIILQNNQNGHAQHLPNWRCQEDLYETNYNLLGLYAQEEMRIHQCEDEEGRDIVHSSMPIGTSIEKPEYEHISDAKDSGMPIGSAMALIECEDRRDIVDLRSPVENIKEQVEDETFPSPRDSPKVDTNVSREPVACINEPVDDDTCSGVKGSPDRSAKEQIEDEGPRASPVESVKEQVEDETCLDARGSPVGGIKSPPVGCIKETLEKETCSGPRSSPDGSIKEQVEEETCSGARGLSTSIGSLVEQSVTFKLGHAETNHGESFVVVGSHDALGCWDPSSGLRMTTDPEKYPAWTARANLSSEDSADIEYKYVLDRGGGDYVWESCENRKLTLPFEIAKVWEKIDDGFGHPGTCLKQIECCMDGAQNGLEAANIPDAISLHNSQDGAAQRLASFSCLDQLIDDANELVGLRAQIKEEWKCEFECEERPVRYGARHLSTPIVIVTSEINPWSKTGGLAMITASYAFEFAFRGHRTMAISPMYADYEKVTCIGNAFVELGGEHHEVRYFHQKHIYGDGKSCDYIFVDHPCFRRSEGMYGPPGGEYADNLFRFTLFAIAAAEAPLILKIDGSTFGQDVLFMCNDWQTGILPVYLLYKYKKHNVYINARSMMVIHNIGYQGKYPQSKFPLDSFFHLPPSLAGPDLEGEDMHMGTDCLNLLAGGIRTADRVLTVSPNYAREIQTAEGGQGIHGILTARAREDRLVGILNGISDEWSPAIDPHIAKNYGVSDFQEGKRICKEALQQELGLNVDPNVCLIGFCGRLCFQKGLSLFMPLLHWLLNDLEGGRSQLIIMGKGEDEWASKVEEAEGWNRGRICGYVGFDPRVEHRMMAGCDLILMPSQYEPCGLPQMYAQAYGTLPVVHETGGLKDSVKGLWDEGRDKDTATGFPFCGFSQDSLKQRLCQAIWMYHHNKPMWKKMQTNAMNLDHYWPTRLDEYEEQVDLTMEGHPQRRAESWWTNHW